MQLPNWLEACLCYQACCALGAPLVPILHLLTADEVIRIVNDCQAEVAVVPRTWLGMDYSSTVKGLRERSPTVRLVLVVGGTNSVDPNVRSFDELTTHGALPEEECFGDLDAPSLIAYTSGATGRPKGVVHSQRTIVASIDAMVRGFGGADQLVDVGMNPNPVGHGTGLFVTCVLPFLHRFRSMLLLDRWDPEEMLSLIAAHRVTLVGGAPIFLQTMLRSPRFETYDSSSLRGFLLGGDVIPPTLVEDADARRWTAVRAYGLTEHPSISMGHPHSDLSERAHTDGRIVEGTTIRIVDETGQDVRSGATGEILVSGSGQCIGLLEGNTVTPATTEGWLHTGDLGDLSADGLLTIRGRLKDVIVRGGEKISCNEVEDVLALHPDVVDVAVAGVPRSIGGQDVVAFVVPRRGCDLRLPDLARHCQAAGLAKHKVPKRVRVIEAIPRSFTGKTQRHVLVAAVVRTRAVK